ncbi:hypothetical protein EST38_g13935 [Candolleomyces aberdarensis]|uniref:Uncharacterized protein n=1 Tax=Candolleomyces aberdarensis TaxID=2316362 RepID=A0A4Q2CYK8_9AGAR|nr:hypothetical protein EST38_g13935 [Candolleomyces aberdarensis]
MIRTPPALAGLLHALTKDGLTDVQTSINVLMDRRDCCDDLLEFYVGDWWSTFGQKEDVRDPNQSVEFTIDCWKTQQRNIVPFVNVTALNQVNLSDLNRKELEEVFSIASDSVNLLELEYDKIMRHLSELTINITQLSTLEKDLKTLKSHYVAERGWKEGQEDPEARV